jgi:hypothetical protein
MTNKHIKSTVQEAQHTVSYPSLYRSLLDLDPYLKLETWLLIEKHVSKFKVCKGDFIFSEGEIVKDFILIDSGKFKAFSQNHSNLIQVRTCLDEFNCLTPIDNKSINSISPLNIQSLMDGYIYKISQATYLDLSSKNNLVKKLFSLIMRKNLNHHFFPLICLLPKSIDDRIEKIQLEVDLLAREAFALQKFKENFPELMKAEPDMSLSIICKLAANYLNVSFDSLLKLAKLEKG